MVLRAKAPELVIPSKPKFLISGESGVGKTFFSLDFPKPYLIDTEGGATRPQYQNKLKASGGAYFGKDEGSQDFNSIIEEVKSLVTTKHDYKTLIIDSFSYIYLLEAAEAELHIGSEFGRDKKEANKPTRQLIRWLEKLDMTVIIICHSKPKWIKKGKEVVQEGNTFDGYDKLEYILDLWIEISKGGKTFLIKKSRIESLPQDASLPLSYANFADVYGREIIESETKPANMASVEQITKIGNLITALNIQDDQVAKWFKKVDVEEWEEMTSEQIESLIDTLNKKIMQLNMKG